jgi:hypothetical protein
MEVCEWEVTCGHIARQREGRAGGAASCSCVELRSSDCAIRLRVKNDEALRDELTACNIASQSNVYLRVLDTLSSRKAIDCR